MAKWGMACLSPSFRVIFCLLSACLILGYVVLAERGVCVIRCFTLQAKSEKVSLFYGFFFPRSRIGKKDSVLVHRRS